MKSLLTVVLTSFLAANIFAQTTCDSVVVEGVHVNPFNENQIILHSNNSSITEFFSYPSWQLLDDQGEVVAVEQVNLFGMTGDVYHVLDVVQPLDYSIESFSGQAVLWTGFEEVAVCSYDLDMFPWMVDEFTTEPYGCVPISLQVHGLATETGSVSFNIANTVTDEYVYNGTIDLVDGEWFYDEIGQACLDQNSCYQLYVNTDIELVDFNLYINMGGVDYGISYTWFPIDSITSQGSVFLDPYGGNCSVGIDEVESMELEVYPNPVNTGGVVRLPEMIGEVKWYSLDGKLVGEDVAVDGVVEVPNKSGALVLVWSKEGRKKRQVVVVE